jgi:hypothetical protein
MFLAGLKCAALTLSIATVLASPEFARAAPQNIRPMAASACQAIAKTITGATGIPLTIKMGVPDFPNDVHGNACLMSGRATGLKAEFDDMEKKANAVFSGWTTLPDISSGGPAMTGAGFAKGAQRVIYFLEDVPPRECRDIVLAACKAPVRRWTWSLKVFAFSISAESGM